MESGVVDGAHREWSTWLLACYSIIEAPARTDTPSQLLTCKSEGWQRQGSWHNSLGNQLLSQLPSKEPSLVSIVSCPALKQGQSLLASPIFSSWGLLFSFPYQSGKATWEPSL